MVMFMRMIFIFSLLFLGISLIGADLNGKLTVPVLGGYVLVAGLNILFIVYTPRLFGHLEL